MINFDNYFKYTVITYLIISIYIWFKKPKLIFDKNNNMKSFGVGKTKTIFYYPFITIILAIIIYFLYFSIYLRKGLNIN